MAPKIKRSAKAQRGTKPPRRAAANVQNANVKAGQAKKKRIAKADEISNTGKRSRTVAFSPDDIQNLIGKAEDNKAALKNEIVSSDASKATWHIISNLYDVEAAQNKRPNRAGRILCRKLYSMKRNAYWKLQINRASATDLRVLRIFDLSTVVPMENINMHARLSIFEARDRRSYTVDEIRHYFADGSDSGPEFDSDSDSD